MSSGLQLEASFLMKRLSCILEMIALRSKVRWAMPDLVCRQAGSLKYYHITVRLTDKGGFS